MLGSLAHRLVSGAFIALACVSVLTGACPGIDHDHALAPRSSRYATQPSGGLGVLRPLTWGDFNVVHTTDIHGWYQGHFSSSQPEPNYSGDWGDFASFVSHLRALAKKKGVDLLVVDSGDLHDGAGLSDGYPPGGVDGHVSNQFHAMIKYDLLSIGNHEMYVYQVAKDTYDNFIPTQNGRYLASNANISIYDEKSGKNETHVLGKQFVKFKTEQGRRVTSLGVLFNFKGQDKGLSVQDPADMVREPWFAQAIEEQPDVFLLAGHMPVSRDQWPTVVSAIRKVHPTVPILILGGHTHVRDCTTYDEQSVGLESGRYLETIGWLSANLSSGSTGTNKNLSFSRSYIDGNRRNYAFHAGLTETRFDKKKGVHITNAMANVASQWNLTRVFGHAPQDYYLSRVSISDDSSLLNLLQQDVLPTVISTSNPARKGTPNIVLANSGAQRFDVYKGNFTKNDQYIVSPFRDAFLYIQDVPLKYANMILDQLNERGAYSKRYMTSRSTGTRKRTTSYAARREEYAQGEVQHVFDDWRQQQYREWLRGEDATTAGMDREPSAFERERQAILDLDAQADAAVRTLGYVTRDSCPGQGDDTAHIALPYARQPDYISSPVTGNSTRLDGTSPIDVIFVDFIASSIISILNDVQRERNYTSEDVKEYNSLTTQDLYPLYAQEKWQ